MSRTPHPVPQASSRRLLTLLAILAALGCARGAWAGGGPTFLGPTAYLSQADSPFDLASGTSASRTSRTGC